MQCTTCGETCQSDGLGAGYGVDADGKAHCYQCCGKRDLEQMMRRGKITLYLSQIPPKEWAARLVMMGKSPYMDGDYGAQERQRFSIINWPGTIKIQPWAVKKVEGWGYGGPYPVHHVWFTGPDGYQWYGVCKGRDSEIFCCRRLKKQACPPHMCVIERHRLEGGPSPRFNHSRCVDLECIVTDGR